MTQWGVVVPPRGERAVPALRSGDEAILLAGLFADGELHHALGQGQLNTLVELGANAWREVRQRVGDLLAADAVPAAARVPVARCTAVRPVRIPDYVDFYASEEHATNLGRIFRPGQPPLADNWHHLPVGYHGRSSTVVVSGTPVRRPRGQLAAGRLAPTNALDFECEVGFVCGPSAPGPIAIDRAADHIFGVVLVNDWSARDIQRFEYVPLGPFLGKSFATSMSAWITPLDDVVRVPPRVQDPAPAPYLRAADPWALDIALEIELNGEVVSRPNAAGLYWTPAQMLAHLTVNGAVLSAGDLFATGTVSGAAAGSEGSLAEIARGERWLADGDEVVVRGRSGEIALGEVRGGIAAA